MKKKRFSKSRRRKADENQKKVLQKNLPRNSDQFSRRKKKKGQAHSSRVVLKANVEKHQKGFAFLVFDQKDRKDEYVSAAHAVNLFHGDRVEVTLGDRGRVIQIHVLEHRFKELVGRFIPHPKQRSGWVIYERKRAQEEVFLPKVKEKLKEGDWVHISVNYHQKGPHPLTGEILSVYGPVLPPQSDITAVAAEYSLVERHSDEAEKEAASFQLDLSNEVLQGRKDLRNLPFITIDGETARDFDDAVFVEADKVGFTLWVAIADVSYYVTEGTALDKEARARGTSVYFPERAFHMLPRALSENLCSLRPNEPRFALVAKMQFSQSGELKKTEVMEALIQSIRRATYTEIEKEWTENQARPDWKYRPHFELYSRLRERRSARGSIDFDLPEAEVKVDPDGTVISITNRARMSSHRLIEEFMIVANEAVTSWMMQKAWPFIYRIHEEPSLEAMKKFQLLAKTVGVSIRLAEFSEPGTLARLVHDLEGHPAQTLLNMALLRSMKQAIYSSTHGIHFGLASMAYTHFTSPIRRYPDLIVHRLIRMALQSENRQKGLKPSFRSKLESQLTEVAEHCSYRERLATEAERESIKIKQVRLMEKHLGESFGGRVVGMIASGLFVQLDHPFVEGLVRAERILDDLYEFQEEKMIFLGARTKKTIRIGDPIKVQVVRVDIEQRQIDFEITK